MDAKTNALALLAAAQGSKGELDGLLEVLGERELSAAIVHLSVSQATTKREQFAAMAMQGFCADPQITDDQAVICKGAVKMADALLAALATGEQP